VSYVGTRSHLRGTINDVMCMRHCLVTRFGYPESQIVVLRDGAWGGVGWPQGWLGAVGWFRGAPGSHLRLLSIIP